MQSTKCYHGLTILFNPKTLRLTMDLGMLKVSLAFAKSICLRFTEEISERIALDPHAYRYWSSIDNVIHFLWWVKG